MLPPSRRMAAQRAAPCWLAMLSVADSSIQMLRPDRSTAHSATATAAGTRTTTRRRQPGRRRDWSGGCPELVLARCGAIGGGGTSTGCPITGVLSGPSAPPEPPAEDLVASRQPYANKVAVEPARELPRPGDAKVEPPSEVDVTGAAEPPLPLGGKSHVGRAPPAELRQGDEAFAVGVDDDRAEGSSRGEAVGGFEHLRLVAHDTARGWRR